MSNQKSKKGDKSSDVAKNIWLAGLGAYGKAFHDAQGKLDKAGWETPHLFKELLQKGAKLEDEARESLDNIRRGRSNVEERINRVRETFNVSTLARSQELDEVHSKLDALTKKVDRLTAALEATKAKPKRKTTTKKAPAKKAAPKKKATGKVAAKKATAKKAAAPRKTAKRAVKK